MSEDVPGKATPAARFLDGGLAAVAAGASVLVLPLSFLLFLQWPLRDWIQQGSREANDLAQILFGLYIAVAVTYATRRRTHLAADAIAHRYPPGLRRWLERAAALFVALPWSLYVLYSGWSSLKESVGGLEGFPETGNPGYFLLRVAVALLAALVAVQAVADLLRRRP